MPSTRRMTMAATTKPRKSIAHSKNDGSNVQVDGRTKTQSTPKRRDRMSMMPRVPGEMGSPLLRGKLSNGGISNTTTTPSRRKSSDKRHSLARTDPRPNLDKAYMSTCIRNLMEYLTDSGYEHPVSMRSLSRPSGKEFSQILTFLLRIIDPTFNDGTMKFEDEVVLTFRHLNYPYPMSKTSLVAAGSPHTWPTLLAALTWLIDYLKMYHISESINDPLSEEGNETDDILDQICSRTENIFFRYFGQSYEAFLNADDNLSDELEVEFIEAFEQDNNRIEQEIIIENEANNVICTEIESLETFGVAPSDSRKTMEQLCGELENFEQLHNQLLEHKKTLQERVTSRTQELQKLEKQLSKNKSTIAALKNSVNRQQLSQDDVKRMRNEISRMRDTLDKTSASRTEIQKMACEHEERFQLKINDLKQIVKQCNATTDRCKRILPYNYAQRENEFVIFVDSTQALNYKTDQSKLFGGIHLQEYAIPTFLQLRDDFCNQLDESKQSLVNLVDKKQSTEITIIDESERSKIAKNKAQKIEEIIQREQQSNGSELSSLLKEVETIEDKVKSSAHPSTFAATIAKYQTQLTEKEYERRRMHEEALIVKQSIQEEIHHALTVAANHKEYIQSDLANLVQDLEEKIGHMQRVNDGDSNDSISDTAELFANAKLR